MNVALDNNNVVDFPANKKSCISFKFKQQVIGQTGNDGTKNVEVIFGEHLKWSKSLFFLEFFYSNVASAIFLERKSSTLILNSSYFVLICP